MEQRGRYPAQVYPSNSREHIVVKTKRLEMIYVRVINPVKLFIYRCSFLPKTCVA